jgi:CHAT domain-containing protein/Tfp pilus assembly protein PilF
MQYLIERGIALFEFHDRDEAEKSFQEALAIARRSGARELIAAAAFELGKLYWTFDRDRERARRYYDEALAAATRARTPHHVVNTLNDIGNLYRDSGEPARALAYYQRALSLERAHRRGRVAAYLTKNIGQVLVRMGRLEEGERWLREGLAQGDRGGIKRIQWQARMELAQLYRRRDRARADRYFGETLDVIEAEHSNVLLDDLRAGSLAVSLAFYDPYDRYIEFLLEEGRSAEAFLVGERARARAFLATLSAAREQLAPAVPAAFLEAEKAILRRISERQAALRTGSPVSAQRAELAAGVRRDEEELSALRVRLALESPQLAHVRYPRLWTVDALRKEALRPEEALAVFFLGRDASVCWIVTREGLQTVRLPRRGEVEPVVRAAMEALRSPGGDVHGAGRRLYDAVAAPVVAHVPEGWRLLVVPHGVLSYLPLETALDSAGRYVIERHAVSYAPSASSLAYLRADPAAPAPGGVLLAVGEPELAGAAPAGERAVDPELAGLLKPLAHGAEELREIRSIFGGATRLLTGARATEEELARVDGATVRVLHFATHGLLDDRRPDRSALALTARPPADDGLLQTREVFRLRLKSRLVTLSACQTALGRELTGEGLVGLARAFFYAGADAVMASLWSVDDASTTRWMAHFYRRLAAGDAIDEAARAAKLAFIRSGGARASVPLGALHRHGPCRDGSGPADTHAISLAGAGRPRAPRGGRGRRGQGGDAKTKGCGAELSSTRPSAARAVTTTV